jgi:hypothetical protein
VCTVAVFAASFAFADSFFFVAMDYHPLKMMDAAPARVITSWIVFN